MKAFAVVCLFAFLFFGFIRAETASQLKARREAAVRRVYEYLIYPNGFDVIRTGGAAALDIFHPNVSGRINPVGDFVGLQNTAEYFYALASPVDGVLRLPRTSFVQSVDIRFIDIVENRASIHVNIPLSAFPTNVTSNLTHAGWYAFEPDTALIRWYDITILRIGQATAQGVSPPVRPGAIAGMCQTVLTYCTGENHQYDNMTHCTNFMNSIEYGTWDNAASNTVVCRGLHAMLIPVRPSYHCPHSGPTGGGKCVTHPYVDWYKTEYVYNIGKDTVVDPQCPSVPTLAPTLTPTPSPVPPVPASCDFFVPSSLPAQTAPNACGLNMRLIASGTQWTDNGFEESPYDISITNEGTEPITQIFVTLVGDQIGTRWNICPVGNSITFSINLWGGLSAGDTRTDTYGFLSHGLELNGVAAYVHSVSC